MKEQVKIRFQNGITYEVAMTEILNIVLDKFDFIESDQPDFVFFGPYGNDVPKPGNYTRIGYYCENIRPDLSACEWAFGVPREEEINNPRYKKIQWHNLDPGQLVKDDSYNAEEIFSGKKHFCNFLYSHKVGYREAFFKQLSKYKKVDAPGRSMNNMVSFDQLYTGDIWQRKKQFLAGYKFTIAFESDIYPGYQTEKLYDAMMTNSIPIYFGDPKIGDVFNTGSFINVADYMTDKSAVIKWLEKNCQNDFVDIRPRYYNGPVHRIKRKLKGIGRELKMYLISRSLDSKQLINRIIELDRDRDKYIAVLKQPWLKDNTPLPGASARDRWIRIFTGK